MPIVSPSTTIGKGLFEGTRSFRSHDSLTDNKDSGGTYDHVATEYSATECEERTDWMRYINTMLKKGVGAISVYNPDTSATTETCVTVDSYDDDEDAFLVAPSEIDDLELKPQFYLLTAIAADDTGIAYAAGTLENVNTSGGSVGDAVYAAASGGWSLSAPADGNITYIIGRISVSNATTGEIELMQPITIPFDSTVPEDLDTAASTGTAVTSARRDHVHALPLGEEIDISYTPSNYTPTPTGATDLEAHLEGIDVALGL